jgi:hypothetical protein
VSRGSLDLLLSVLTVTLAAAQVDLEDGLDEEGEGDGAPEAKDEGDGVGECGLAWRVLLHLVEPVAVGGVEVPVGGAGGGGGWQEMVGGRRWVEGGVVRGGLLV